MDADRRDEALTGSALDREIRAALDVDPSPEFLARVRTGIASEPRRAAWRWSWMFAAACAMAALIAIAIVSRDARSSRLRDLAPPPDVAQAFRPAGSGAEQAPPLLPGPVVSGSRRMSPQPSDPKGPALRPMTTRSANAFALQPREPARSADAAARQPREPEILVDPRESMALRRLIAGTREGTLDLSAALQPTTPTAMDLPPLSEIAIPVITIDPITPEAGDEGARQ